MKTTVIGSLTPMLLSLLALTSAMAQQTPPWPGHWHIWGGGWPMWWVFPSLMLLFFAICLAFLFFSHRSSAGRHHWGPPGQMTALGNDPTRSALQILNERFAKGEIQREEYEEKKAAIRSSDRYWPGKERKSPKPL